MTAGIGSEGATLYLGKKNAGADTWYRSASSPGDAAIQYLPHMLTPETLGTLPGLRNGVVKNREPSLIRPISGQAGLSSRQSALSDA